MVRMVGSGPQGVDRIKSEALIPSSSLAPTITDPFILYQSLVAANQILADPAQLRVMKDFQKLYHRLIDYLPKYDVQNKIALILRDLEMRRFHSPTVNQKKWLERIKWYPDPERHTKQVIRLITDEEEIGDPGYSPQGIMINGDVGCGKLMLMDIFALCLPHQSKMRWHYHNFILWVFEEMHRIQNERQFERLIEVNHGHYSSTRVPSWESEFLLFHVARKMMEKNTVLMLDEFMLPDIALAQIIKILFTYYFKLGGVLVATSNKLPEELYSGNFNKTRFAGFVSILHARCQLVDMKEGTTDYRAKTAGESTASSLVDLWEDPTWEQLLAPICSGEQKKTKLPVYGRHLNVTTYGSVAYLEFDDICRGLHSASDYITLALTFPVVVLDHVPVLTFKTKNEARRLITLVDALYESRCQVFLRTAAPLDRLFFPDGYSDDTDVQDQEMYARTVIDSQTPYRPNVSGYDEAYTRVYHTEVENSKVQKVDFTKSAAFTGEDEMFAYKRAVLRISEMVLDKWRVLWVPLDGSMRPWEKEQRSDDVDVVPPVQAEKPAENSSPVISSGHVWQMGNWSEINAERAKDPITKTWIRTGLKNE